MQIKIWRYIILCAAFAIFASPTYSQYSMGSVGLLNTPSAEMNEDGVARVGSNYLPESMTPSAWDYDSANYFLGITFLPFVDISIRYTLLKESGKWNQDRSVSLKLRLFKERKWVPAIAVGSNDLLTTNELNVLSESTSNRYFSSIFGVMTKHFESNIGEFGVTMGGYLPIEERQTSEGVFGGVSYAPNFYKDLKFIAEYNDGNVNIGSAVKLFNCLSLYGYAYDLKVFTGGVRYEIDLF